MCGCRAQTPRAPLRSRQGPRRAATGVAPVSRRTSSYVSIVSWRPPGRRAQHAMPDLWTQNGGKRRQARRRGLYVRQVTSTDPPREGVRLREFSDAKRPHRDFDGTGWDILPRHLLDIVEAVE